MNRLVVDAINTFLVEGNMKLDAGATVADKLLLLEKAGRLGHLLQQLQLRALVPAARCAHRLLRVLTGRWYSAATFLHAKQLERLTANRFFEVTVAGSWLAHPLAMRLKPLPTPPHESELFQATDAIETNLRTLEVRIRFAHAQSLRQRIAGGAPMVVSLPMAVAISLMSYLHFVERHQIEQMVENLRRLEAKIAVSFVDGV